MRLPVLAPRGEANPETFSYCHPYLPHQPRLHTSIPKFTRADNVSTVPSRG